MSIVFAAQVDSKYNAGDYGGAMASSEKAKNWAIASAITGLVVGAIYFLLIVGASD